jgi:hypothetical protein
VDECKLCRADALAAGRTRSVWCDSSGERGGYGARAKPDILLGARCCRWKLSHWFWFCALGILAVVKWLKVLDNTHERSRLNVSSRRSSGSCAIS